MPPTNASAGSWPEPTSPERASTRTSRRLDRRSSRSRRARTALAHRMTSQGCCTPRSPGRAARSTRSRSGILRTGRHTTRPGSRTGPSSGSTTLANAHDTDHCDLDRRPSRAHPQPLSIPPVRSGTVSPGACQRSSHRETGRRFSDAALATVAAHRTGLMHVLVTEACHPLPARRIRRLGERDRGRRRQMRL